MWILKVLMKLLLIPVWMVLALLTLFVSVVVSVFGIARAVSGFVLALLLVGTLLCYQDMVQIMFLLGIIAIGYLFLFAGVTIEVILEETRRKIGKMILA